MVFLTNILGYAGKKIPRKYLRSGFMDSLRIHVKAGAGGMGLPRYGGIGGKGGDVYVITENGLTLDIVSSRTKKKFIADAGGNSSPSGLIGEPGQDFIVPVPTGITVYGEDGAVIGDLDKPDVKLKVASGGIGGCPETGFSGQKGQSHAVVLDLKLIADIGLVGFPNAGKSTLLRGVSAAKPKVAAYPFTTIRPHLGIIRYPDLRTISVADLPGLIEGAHANIGMGHKFLKHLDRTKLLAFIVDIQGFQLSAMHKRRTCLETIILLNKEVELYKPDLLKMPAILIVNKMDTKDATDIFRDIKSSLKDLGSVVNDYPEEMRPEKILEFAQIITTTLIGQKTEEIEKVKNVMRTVLDDYYLQKIDEENKFDEIELIDKIKRETRQKAPTLV